MNSHGISTTMPTLRGLICITIFLAMTMAHGFVLAQQSGSSPDAWMSAPPASTGIHVGQRIPAFRAVDQTGRTQDFNSLRGPHGAAIVFSRSADW